MMGTRKCFAKALLVASMVWLAGCGSNSGTSPNYEGPVTITFDPNGGTVSLTSASTGENGKLTSLPTPTWSGHTFDGWFTAATGGTEVTASTVFSANATVYARWTEVPVTPGTYTITFNPNGGAVTPSSALTDADGKIASLPTPTRSGYTFDGWFTAATGGTEVTASTVFSANATIYARWTETPVENGVLIGNQVWMKKNLNVETADSWCYGNSADSCAKYGRLYTWSAAKTACPIGWHLPSSEEWKTLRTYVGGYSVAGSKLKSTSGWYNNANGTDEYGFSALPGGNRGSDGSFDDADKNGLWWTATENSDGNAYYWFMAYNNDNLLENDFDKDNGFSVRCVLDNIGYVAYTITFDPTGGRVTPTFALTDVSEKLASLPTPTRSGYTFNGWFTAATGGTAVTTTTVFTANATVYARWSEAVEPVTIGNIVWMKKNLNVETADSWCYDNDPENCAKYGRLYTWSAAKTACPTGWHLPSREEWNTLETYAGGSSVAGTKLKSTSGWIESGNGTDEYGFSALPGGYRSTGGSFDNAGIGYWWTATEVSNANAYYRIMVYNEDYFIDDPNVKTIGFSVRCVGN